MVTNLSIHILTGNELGDNLTTKELRKAALLFAQTHLIGKSFVNASSGHVIKVTKQGVKHSLFNANNPEVKTFVGLAQMLEHAIYQGSMPDKLGRTHIKAAHTYLATVRLGEELLQIGILTHEKHTGHEHYNHAVVKLEAIAQ